MILIFDLTGVKKSILSENSFCMLLARLLESRVRLEKADLDRAPVLLNPPLLANRNYFPDPVTVLVRTFDKLRSVLWNRNRNRRNRNFLTSGTGTGTVTC
jgi:hypothetical protein